MAGHAGGDWFGTATWGSSTAKHRPEPKLEQLGQCGWETNPQLLFAAGRFLAAGRIHSFRYEAQIPRVLEAESV